MAAYKAMTAVGIDIGTTTISINLSEQDSGRVVNTKTISNASDLILQKNVFEDLQDAEYILKLVENTIDEIISAYGEPAYIGVTGQMHGIIYINEKGTAVSPLYTWRDASSCEKDISVNGKTTYIEQLENMTGCYVAPGWGMSTLYCHTIRQVIPDNAVCVCTVADYISMRLAGKCSPLMHISNAASLGLFDIEHNCFYIDKIKKAGIDINLIPNVTEEYAVVGYYNEKIPVCLAIGDNQAGFLSSVCDEKNSVLANIGTGGQISFVSDYIAPSEGLEIRPLVKNKYIMVGSSLCGGMALSILEQFFRKTAELVTNTNIESAYGGIDRCLEMMLDKFYHGGKVRSELDISSRFCGTRSDPSERGYIKNISMNNFIPEELICGFLYAMADELYNMYKNSYAAGRHTKLIGSGNAVRKNVFLQKVLSEVFGMDIYVPAHMEEAAYGAAIFGSVCSGISKDLDEARSKITYL